MVSRPTTRPGSYQPGLIPAVKPPSLINHGAVTGKPPGEMITPNNTSGMSSSYAGAFTAPGLMNEYNQKYAEARSANENRYNEIKGGYGDLWNRSMNHLEGQGASELAGIRQTGEAAKAANSQRMQSLGLGGTTVGSTLNTGVDRQVTEQTGALNERLNAQRLGTDQSITNNRLNFMERREDAYPDMGTYASLMSQMGRVDGGAGGGYAASMGSGGGGASSAASGTMYAPFGQNTSYGADPRGGAGNGAYGQSVIAGDQGTRRPVYTGGVGNRGSVVYRTNQENALARNPFLLGG